MSLLVHSGARREAARGSLPPAGRRAGLAGRPVRRPAGGHRRRRVGAGRVRRRRLRGLVPGRAALGDRRPVPGGVRPARGGPPDPRALAGQLQHLLDHGGHGLARVGRAPQGGAAAGLLREQPGQPHVLAARLRGHGAQRAGARLLRALGGPGVGVVGPVSAPRQVAAVPARRAPPAGGALPARAAGAAGQRRRQVGGHDPRRRGRGRRLPRAGRVRVVERVDLRLLQRLAQHAEPPHPRRGLGRRLPGVQASSRGRGLPATARSSSRTAGAQTSRTRATCGSPTTTPPSGTRWRCSRASSPRATTTPSTSTTRSAAAAGSPPAAGSRRGSPTASPAPAPAAWRRSRSTRPCRARRTRCASRVPCGVSRPRRTPPPGPSPWRGTTRCAWRSRPR